MRLNQPRVRVTRPLVTQLPRRFGGTLNTLQLGAAQKSGVFICAVTRKPITHQKAVLLKPYVLQRAICQGQAGCFARWLPLGGVGVGG